MSSWWGTGDQDQYKVTGMTKGWFGESKVTKTVTGKRKAERLADQMRRRGDRHVRVTRGGWWAL